MSSTCRENVLLLRCLDGEGISICLPRLYVHLEIIIRINSILMFSVEL